MTAEGKFTQGPYLSAAFLCEKVLTDTDGARSAIRIIDKVIRTVSGPSTPETMEPFNYPVILFLRFQSGLARGPLELEVRVLKPVGEFPTQLRRTMSFEGDDGGSVDMVGNLLLWLDQPGLYWFDVYLDNVRVTRVPLRVFYQPRVTQMNEPVAGSSQG
jgi:hypothetical protein